MKRTILTTGAIAALALGIVTVMSTSAQASTPKAKFGAMKKALNAKQDKTMVSVTIQGDESGQPKMKVMINGQLVDVPVGTPFEFHDGNKKIIVKTLTNLDDLSPEERAKLEEMISKTMKGDGNGGVTKKVFINGKEVTGAEADKVMKGHGVKVMSSSGKFTGKGNVNGVWIDMTGTEFTLNETDYSNIKFGSNENTLFLTPKKRGDVRYSLKIDPKTNLPSLVTMQQSKGGKWTDVNSSKFQYKPKTQSKKIKV